ncbi:response regulator [Spirochaeta cellobiosiphila]|uniref:response regulator n=1 Tax=Spirochaeta cellobiosiphila TaxID=504483 RepID=UPI00069D6893|nr:response regulator [Spirochaeta cellobiosiphila]
MSKTVMVVEDESIIRLHYEQILRKAGMTIVKGTGSGELAVDMIIHSRPALVFMDINLQGQMTGIDVVEKVKESIPEQKVIYVTAYNDQETQKRVEATKPVGIFAKPLTKLAISQIISNYL